jgi:hypothetical protein
MKKLLTLSFLFLVSHAFSLDVTGINVVRCNGQIFITWKGDVSKEYLVYRTTYKITSLTGWPATSFGKAKAHSSENVRLTELLPAPIAISGFLSTMNVEQAYWIRRQDTVDFLFLAALIIPILNISMVLEWQTLLTSLHPARILRRQAPKTLFLRLPLFTRRALTSTA